MARLNFAFSFVGHSPSHAELAKATVAWVGWRHRGAVANAAVVDAPSVAAAIATMLDTLKKGDEVGDVYIYSHAVSNGRLRARLRDTNALGDIQPKVAAAFAERSKEVRRVAAFTTAQTAVHLYSCNVGKSQDSLGAWRQVFAGGVGSACGPTQYYHLGLLKPQFSRSTDTKYRGARRGCPQVAATIDPKSEQDLEAQLAERVDAPLDALTAEQTIRNKPVVCLPTQQAENYKEAFREAAKALFEGFLLDTFGEMRPSGHIAPDLFSADPVKDRAQILKGMWDLWSAMTPFTGSGGGAVAYPFLSTRLLSAAQTRAIKTPAALKRSKMIVGPGSPSWPAKWISKPHGVGLC